MRTVGCSDAMSAFKHTLGNHEALNFAGALVDFRYARISVVTLDAKLRRVSVAAMDLDGFVGDARTRLGREQLRLGALQRVSNVPVLARCRAQREKSRGIELR